VKDKFFVAAKAVSMNGTGVGGGRKSYRLGAVLVNKKSYIISVGNNSYKTHPLLKYRTEWPFLHAEQHAIIKRGLDNCEGLDLYVVRILKNLNYAISYPCTVCKVLIKEVGIRNVYYIDVKGNFARAVGQEL
jgi:deoxycytidylate deaminase